MPFAFLDWFVILKIFKYHIIKKKINFCKILFTFLEYFSLAAISLGGMVGGDI